MICQICNQEVKDNKHFWREHKISQEVYFHKYYPKKDLLTGETIPFLNQAQYFKQDFINRANFKQWLKYQTPAKKQEYCKNLLISRKNDGKLVYTPSFVEIKSLDNFPPIAYFDKVFNSGFLGVCKEIGLIERFIDSEKIDFKQEIIGKILVDTREQSPLTFTTPTEVIKLDFGDYTSEKRDLYIERKSLVDFIGSFGTGYERLSREFQRAMVEDKRIVVLVEEKLDNVLNFNKIQWIKSKVKASPDFIFHNVREAMQSFSNLQFLFVNGREEAARVAYRLFSIPDIFKADLQMCFEKGLL